MHDRDGIDRRQFLGLAVAGLVMPAPARAQDDAGTLTLSNASLLDHTGQVTKGAGLRVEGGRFVEVGPAVRGGEDVGGAWLVPGFTDAGCVLGLYEIGLESGTHDDAESSDAITPDARVRDAYNPLSDLVPVARLHGVTSVLVHPDTGGLISGQAALMRTAGDHVADTTLLAPAGLCINLGHAAVGDRANAPKSRMGVAMRLRELFDGVELPGDPAAGSRRQRRRRSGSAEADDDKPATQVLRQLLQGKLKAIVKAERADDISLALDLIDAYHLDAALLGCTEGHLVADRIASAGVPVLLGPITTQPDSFEHPHARYDNAAILHAAGVTLCLRTGSAHGVRTLPTLAGVAVAHGLPYEAAITALTAAPGDVFGVPGLGRMDVGAPATFFQIDGDPLQPRFPVRRVWMEGRPTSMESRQTRLHDAFRVLK